MPRKLSLPKCPKCRFSFGLSLNGCVATCSYCAQSWKPSLAVRQKITDLLESEREMRQVKQSRAAVAAAAVAAKYERLNRRDARGWLVRDDELDLSTLSTEELVKHRDRLTEHLDGLAEEGFVDRDVMEPQHSGYCYEMGENGLDLAACDADCPVAIAKRERYLASAYREHSRQLTFEDLMGRVSHTQLLEVWADPSAPGKLSQNATGRSHLGQ